MSISDVHYFQGCSCFFLHVPLAFRVVDEELSLCLENTNSSRGAGLLADESETVLPVSKFDATRTVLRGCDLHNRKRPRTHVTR